MYLKHFLDLRSVTEYDWYFYVFKVVTEDTVIEALVPTTVSLLCWLLIADCLYQLQTLLFIMLVFYLWTSVLRRVIGLSGDLLILMCSFFPLFFLSDIDVYFFLF